MICWWATAGCSLMDPPPASLDDDRLATVLPTLVLPKLGPGDLARLACTCQGLRELADSAEAADALRAALPGVLPSSHPALQPCAQGLTGAQLRAAAGQYNMAQTNAAKGRLSLIPAAKGFDDLAISPDCQHVAMMQWSRGAPKASGATTKISLFHAPSMDLLQTTSVHHTSPSHQCCRWESDSRGFRLITWDRRAKPTKPVPAMARPWWEQAHVDVRVLTAPDLHQAADWTVKLPRAVHDNKEQQFPSPDGQHLVVCGQESAFCVHLDQDQPVGREFALGSVTGLQGLAHDFLPLYAIPEHLGGQGNHAGFRLSINSMDGTGPEVQGPVVRGYFVSMTWSSPGHTAAVCTSLTSDERECGITVLDTRTGSDLYNNGPIRGPPRFAISQQGALAVSSAYSLQVWSGPQARLELELKQLESWNGEVVFSPAGNFLVFCCCGQGNFLFNALQGFEHVDTQPAFKEAEFRHCQFDSSGERMLMRKSGRSPGVKAVNLLLVRFL